MSKERQEIWRRLLSLSLYFCSVPVEKHSICTRKHICRFVSSLLGPCVKLNKGIIRRLFPYFDPLTFYVNCCRCHSRRIKENLNELHPSLLLAFQGDFQIASINYSSTSDFCQICYSSKRGASSVATFAQTRSYDRENYVARFATDFDGARRKTHADGGQKCRCSVVSRPEARRDSPGTYSLRRFIRLSSNSSHSTSPFELKMRLNVSNSTIERSEFRTVTLLHGVFVL